MLEKMRPIIAEQLNVQESEIKENTKLKLDTLLLVAEKRNFTRAAQALSLTQPAVSHHISQLEEEFGVEIPSEDLESIVTVGDVITYLKNRGVTA